MGCSRKQIYYFYKLTKAFYKNGLSSLENSLQFTNIKLRYYKDLG